MTIDICITACRRPDLLEKTLDTFTKNLFFTDTFTPSDYHVYINVDPAGLNVPSENIVAIAKDYFPHVTFRISKTPHFPTAFVWCWGKTKSDLVFYLEEDWELLRPLSMIDMVNTVKNPANKLIHLRLSQWRTEDLMKNWKWFLPFNKNYFMVPDDVKGTIGFCGHPSLNKGWFIRKAAEYINPKLNPEKQIKWRNKGLWEHLKDHSFGVYQGQWEPPTVRDIGRAWMVKHNLRKEQPKEWFTKWEDGSPLEKH